ncbi:major capsid protein [Microbacterium lacus]|uniref:major capsid protein n=1 Tax=Microbacterium lacus TaxID=415217 RepID=UPI000C2BA256|nr:major capsid protein [Microbacterium lacus]
MGFTPNFRTPVQLTGVARAAFDLQVGQYITDGLLPVNETYDINFSFGVTQAALPPAASFRSFNSESDVGSLGVSESRSGKLPPISRRLHVDEYQQLTMYQSSDDLIGAEFERYATSLGQAFALRFVMAQAEAITAGKVTIAERGLTFEVNYGRKAGLTANAATPWSTIATADPLTDIEGLRAVYGRRIGRIVLSRQAMGYLQTNANIIKIAMQRGSDLPPRISVEDVRAVFRDYGLGEIVVNEEVVTNSAGAEVPLFAADKVIILPAAGAVGRTDLGVTAESIRTDTGIAQSERPGLFAGALESDDPSGYDVLVSAIGLPILTDANATGVIDAF